MPTAAAAQVGEPPEVTFPDETTTGVPPGTELTPSGSIEVTQDGAVIEDIEVTGGIQVAANDVTIRRTLVRGIGLYPVQLMGGYRGLVVEDSEIVGPDSDSAAVCCSNYTLRRVDIHDVPEGPRMNGDVTIVDSYIHHLVPDPEGHQDTLQSTKGSGIVVRGNNLQAFNPDNGYLMNSTYQFGTTQGPLTDVLFEGNLLNGGNYTINGGGGGTEDGAATFRNNYFGRDHRYGPAANLGVNVSFDDTNVWLDTREPVIG